MVASGNNSKKKWNILKTELKLSTKNEEITKIRENNELKTQKKT